MIQFAKKFRTILEKAGKVTTEQGEALMVEAHQQKRPITEVAVKNGVVQPGEMLALIGRAANIPPINLAKLKVNKDVLQTVPVDVAREYKVFPIDRIGNILTVAVANPFDVLKLDDIRIITGCQLRMVISTEEAIEQLIPVAYRADEESVGDILGSFDDSELELKEDLGDDEGMDLTAISDESSPVVKMVNKIIVDAVTQGASDIHFEPFEKKMIVRYRRDGCLVEAMS